MQDKILKIITDALKGADAKFDTDGQTVWVDGKDGRTFAVCVSECAGDADADEGDQTYTVHLHASFMGAFDVKAGSEDDLFYDTSDFSEVKLTGSYAGNEPMRDCFYGSTDLEMATLLTYDCTYEAEVQMGRPIAKFNFISTDRDKFIDYWVQQQAIRSGSLVKIDRNKVDLNKFTVRWVYPQFLPNTFNLHSGRPVDSATGVRFDVPMRVNEDGNVDLGFDWMFVNPTESKVVVSLEIYDQEGAYLSTVSNIEVPLMRSHFTTVEGNILTNGINNGVSIDPTYDGEFTIIL